MYDVVGAPSKTQAIVREICARMYVGCEIGQGYPGDEDNGEMSAWYVLSSLGYLPVAGWSARTGSIGSPQFTKDDPCVARPVTSLVNAKNNSTKERATCRACRSTVTSRTACR